MEPNEEEEGEGFSQDVFYPDTSNDPGPSGISGNNHKIIFPILRIFKKI